MPYYGDTPGQASGLQLQDEASQRQYALGLAQQQLAAQQAAADLNFRKQAFQQGLVDSALNRADQRALNDRTFAFEDKTLAAKTKQNQDALEAPFFDDAKKMISSGTIKTEPELIATFHGRLGATALETLARYGELASKETSKRGAEAARYAEGLNNQLKPLQDKIDKATIALGQRSSETNLFGRPVDTTGAQTALENAKAELFKQREALSTALAKSHLDTAIAIDPTGVFRATLSSEVQPFRLPKPVTRGLRPTPTATVAPLGARATYDPATGWSGPGTGPNSGIEAAGRWSGGLTNTPAAPAAAPAEAPYAGADDRGVGFAPPAAPVSPARAPVSNVYVRIPHNNTHEVRVDAQRLVDATFQEINATITNPGAHQAAVRAAVDKFERAGIMRRIVVPPPRVPPPEMRPFETMSF